MWDFLSGVLEKGGVVAAIFVLYSIGIFFAFRALWNANQKLHDRVAEVQKEEGEKRSKMREAHDHEIDKIRTAVLEETQRFATRIDDLQERRVAESQEVIREVIKHVQHTRLAVERVGDTMDVLKDVVTGARRV